MSTRLVYPYGAAVTTGRLKSFAEDFVVDEELGFQPSGAGEHLFIRVEKINLTTAELIDCLAKDVGIKPGDIGYSGLKDKKAVTRQWLSLYIPGRDPTGISSQATDYTVLEQVRHNKKLRQGTHRFNRFEVLLRDVEHFEDKTHDQMQSIKTFGMANYFGEQRFGGGSDNVQRALQAFSSERKTKRLTRKKKSLYLSSLRSELFNRILSRRIDAGIWLEPVNGDVFMLNGSQSIFTEAVNDQILQRYRRFDISSTASLYGTGRVKPGATALDIENAVYGENSDICVCIEKQNMKLQMRAIRVAVKDFSFEYAAKEKQLKIKTILPTGSYCTSLLNHFIKTES